MADKSKHIKQLKLVAAFEDGDDRTVTIDNPKNGLTKTDINAKEFVDLAKEVLIGDKTGAPMTKWKSAKVYESTVTYLDLKS